MSTTVPGRIALLGEHCDWAGGASLVAPLPGLALDVSFRADVTGRLRVRTTGVIQAEVELPVVPDALGHGPLRYVSAVLQELAARGHVVTGGELVVESTLPPGRGFSSSAALCVAAARALSGGLGPDEEAAIAFAAERQRVGVACGLLDQLAVAWARPLLIRWGQPPDVQPLESPVPDLVVGVFSEPRDTPGILAALAACQRGEGTSGQVDAVRRAIGRWGEAAPRGAQALADGDRAALGELMDDAQGAYDAIAAVLPPLRAPGLQAACAALRAAGALGAKFSGAGGDGSVVALARGPDHALELVGVLEARRLAAWALAAR